ncbi:MAG: TetR/AcrR family transcriptional regulator [Elusimicrobiaceae bacterium]|nr:TetR/AcrR family transcriptional regulator [Elusimicrobiaceae bacterium]
MQNTRLKLLRIAARLFAKNGYTSTSVREIVQTAGENVSSISYHFGNKRTLYLETLKYLLSKNRDYIFGGDRPLPTPQDIDKLSLAQTWEALHRIIDKVLDMKFNRINVPLERIFTFAELEGSAEMLTSLKAFAAPINLLIRHTLAKLTGIKENSSEMVLLAHLIFLQVNLSECDRFMILRALGENPSQHTPPVKLKQAIWHSIETILKSYKKGKKNEKISIACNTL